LKVGSRVFIGLKSEEVLLEEAQRQQVLLYKRASTPEKQEAINRRREEEKAYLPKVVIENEKKKLFKVNIFDHRNQKQSFTVPVPQGNDYCAQRRDHACFTS